jgi:hypothetical protein
MKTFNEQENISIRVTTAVWQEVLECSSCPEGRVLQLDEIECRNEWSDCFFSLIA